MKHNCRYVLKPNYFNHETKEFTSAIYCGKKVGYRIKLDDDMNKYRSYNTFCKEHQKIVDSE